MIYYMKQKAFSLKEKFDIVDEKGTPRYYCEGTSIWTYKPVVLYDMNGVELLQVKRKMWTWMPQFEIFMDGQLIAKVEKVFRWFKPEYKIEGMGLSVEGDVWGLNYSILKDGIEIAHINKKVWTWTDSYEIDVEDENYTEIILCLVIAIDNVLDEQEANS